MFVDSVSEKECRLCHKVKPIDEFYKRGAMRSGRSNECKRCLIEASARWIQQHHSKHACNQAKYQARKQNRTEPRLETYPQRLEDVSPTCEICDFDGRLVYDHDHKTGAFRGMLCAKCNKRLGILERDMEWYLGAMKYLKHHRSKL